ncbi:hypothetical protein DUNSADRAFT_2107 [Dunaliella salina]|uniref:Encoded protein n=1 Tax=Dunaliella salina TaxID=3046 RepID=A0ABQ7GW68_DUNSA|nr:hypothetical protein DUNSADRAFT_2107 [Dunaliella salina]|eukprot:KAF5838849.1 hypothetical protein DUNSADRAFT_2107 [Dunaliella salina]
MKERRELHMCRGCEIMHPIYTCRKKIMYDRLSYHSFCSHKCLTLNVDVPLFLGKHVHTSPFSCPSAKCPFCLGC